MENISHIFSSVLPSFIFMIRLLSKLTANVFWLMYFDREEK